MTFEDIIKCDSDNRDKFSRLKKLCKSGNVTPFIGAGMCIPPYASWRETLKMLLGDMPNEQKNLEALFEKGQYEQAADYVYKVKGKGEFEYSFKQIFSVDKIRTYGCSSALKKIPYLFDGPVITSNYDKCIEKVYDDADNPFTSVIVPRVTAGIDDAILGVIRENAHLLLKIHGDCEILSSRILSTEEYDEIYNPESGFFEIINNLFSAKVLLFLGCSLSGNDRYMNILSELGKEKKIFNYAFLKKPIIKSDEEKKEFIKWKKRLSDCFILPIWYPEYDDRHESVDILLQQLRSDKEKTELKNSKTSKEIVKIKVSEAINSELEKKGIHLNLPDNEKYTVDDIVAICKGKNTKLSQRGLTEEIYKILGCVYDKKYGKREISKDVRGLNSEWINVFYGILKENKIDDLSTQKTLVVGIGNGEEGAAFKYSEVAQKGNLIISDIAEESLRIAENRYKGAEAILQPAQDLSRIADDSIDVYISTMVYQSSFFNREKALYEATRVLKENGLVIISISNGFLNGIGEYRQGLYKAGTNTLNPELPKEIVNEIKEKLQILGFKVYPPQRCNSEIFVYATKSD